MRIECFAGKKFSNDWRVEAIDSKTGDCFVTVFSGPDSQKRAEEYAAWYKPVLLCAYPGCGMPEDAMSHGWGIGTHAYMAPET